jgi:hypothetical protein
MRPATTRRIGPIHPDQTCLTPAGYCFVSGVNLAARDFEGIALSKKTWWNRKAGQGLAIARLLATVRASLKRELGAALRRRPEHGH